jgi:hypothetical protein
MRDGTAVGTAERKLGSRRGSRRGDRLDSESRELGSHGVGAGGGAAEGAVGGVAETVAGGLEVGCSARDFSGAAVVDQRVEAGEGSPGADEDRQQKQCAGPRPPALEPASVETHG